MSKKLIKKKPSSSVNLLWKLPSYILKEPWGIQEIKHYEKKNLGKVRGSNQMNHRGNPNTCYGMLQTTPRTILGN